ncbi:hypothetical protein D9613_010662 [Agrocybe pediades]|uniref:GST N-terminal domain-containing protein n=1 Tax=Agrocybe pediades TaxID=84607 RepID=A0A8H4QFQ4_9AGAR|nr:hypothetical protein D9613_010662 [Agrocybe pediades]
MGKTDITLLDIPCALSVPISLNTWRVRLALNYKKLEYSTQWVESSAIEATCRFIGLPPTGTKRDGSPHYTLPAIIDRTNPDRPVLLSDSIPILESFQSLFMQFVMPKLMAVAPDLVVGALLLSKTPNEQPHYRRRMEAAYGKPFEDLEKRGPEREAVYRSLEQTFTSLKTAMDKNEDGEFLSGGQVLAIDLVFAAYLIWLQRLSPDEIWPRIVSWDNGRWERYLDNFKDWMTVV